MADGQALVIEGFPQLGSTPLYGITIIPCLPMTKYVLNLPSRTSCGLVFFECRCAAW